MLYRNGKIFILFFFFALLLSEFLPAQSLEIKNIKQFYLSNKLRVVLIQDKDNPLVRLRLLIFNGEASSPPGLEGLATLTARSFFKGSILFSEESLSRLLSYHGCNIKTKVAEERTSFSISLPLENFERFLNILGSLLIENIFPKSALNVERNILIRELKVRKDNPSYYTFDFFYKNLFKKTPYIKILFTEDSLGKINPQNCLSFLKRYYIPNNSVLIVWGDFEPDNLKRTLERKLARWTEKSLFYPYVPSPTPVRENIISILNSPLQDSYFIMGNTLKIPTIEDRATLLLFNEILGGSDFSRIDLKLKDTLDYCRSIESGFIFLKNEGIFYVAGQCRTEKIGEVVTSILLEIKDLKERRIEEKELKGAKDYLIGEIIVKNSDPEEFLTNVEDAILNNFPLNYMEKLLRGIEGCSREEILSVVSKYFKIESNFVVVAGKKEKLVDSLKDFGKIEIYNKINNSWEKEK